MTLTFAKTRFNHEKNFHYIIYTKSIYQNLYILKYSQIARETFFYVRCNVTLGHKKKERACNAREYQNNRREGQTHPSHRSPAVVEISLVKEPRALAQSKHSGPSKRSNIYHRVSRTSPSVNCISDSRETRVSRAMRIDALFIHHEEFKYLVDTKNLRSGCRRHRVI